MIKTKKRDIFDVYKKKDDIVFFQDVKNMILLSRVTRNTKTLFVPMYVLESNDHVKLHEPVEIYIKKEINGFLIKMRLEDMENIDDREYLLSIPSKIVKRNGSQDIMFYFNLDSFGELLLLSESKKETEFPNNLLHNAISIEVMKTKKKRIANVITQFSIT